MITDVQGQKINYVRPAIAAGCEPSMGLKLTYQEALKRWKSIHGELKEALSDLRKEKTRNVSNYVRNVVIYDDVTKYFFLGRENHRRPNSLGGKFVDWLIANQGATESDIKKTEHDLKHLRWDMKNNPQLFTKV